MQILEKNCVICNKVFYKESTCSLVRWNTSRRFCSQKCLSKDKVVLLKRKIGIIHSFENGRTAWNKGIPSSDELSNSWKGDEAGYSAKHKWIESKLGRPDTCEHCKKSSFRSRQIHWANKDHKYKRILTDWIRLCAKCHQTYDRINNNY